MTKKSFLFLFCCFVLTALGLLVFTKQTEDRNTHERYLDNNMVNDAISLDEALTKEYDLEELQLFFNNHSMNDRVKTNTDSLTLCFTEVDQQFPVEVIRSSGYTVYKVSNGGYYYVFWAAPLQEEGELAVYFSAYLPQRILTKNKFEQIKANISSAKDVKQVDPSMELSFLTSNGVKSYSYIDDKTVLEIKYMYAFSIYEYDDLVVEEMKLIPRETSPSRYSGILIRDLP